MRHRRVSLAPMPAPLDLSPVGGWDAVRTLTVAIGPREAARQLGIPQHTDAIMRRCSRECWLKPPPAVPLPLSIRPQPVRADVRDVRTAPEAMANALEDLGSKSKLNVAKWGETATGHAASLKGAKALAAAPDVKAAASTLATAKLPGWEREFKSAAADMARLSAAELDRLICERIDRMKELEARVVSLTESPLPAS
jgi:hypothetical protein